MNTIMLDESMITIPPSSDEARQWFDKQLLYVQKISLVHDAPLSDDLLSFVRWIEEELHFDGIPTVNILPDLEGGLQLSWCVNGEKIIVYVSSVLQCSVLVQDSSKRRHLVGRYNSDVFKDVMVDTVKCHLTELSKGAQYWWV